MENEENEDDIKLTRVLRKGLFTTRLSSFVYVFLLLSLSLGVSFIFYITAIQMGGVFYAFLFFIPIIILSTLVAVYYKLKITWGESQALHIAISLGVVIFFISLAYIFLF